MCEERHCYRDNVHKETTIELCDDVLEEVFSYLNVKDLKNASLVCKRWNEFTESSTAIMKKFKFRVQNLQLKNFGSSRNHQNYVIHTDESIDWTSLAGNIQVDRVKTLHIRRSRFCSTISYETVKFVSSLTKLEKLTLEDVTLTVTEEFTQPIKMPKLNSLVINGDDFTILEHIEVKELQDLRCIGSCSNSPKDFEPIGRSIVRLSHLKRLSLSRCMETFEYIDVHQAKCRLSFIEVYHINVHPVDVNAFAANLRKFLLLQAESLQVLSFDFSLFDVEVGRNIVNDFLQIAFNKCTNLTSLDIRNLSIPCDGEFYKSLEPNYSIKSLRVHWNFHNEVIDGLLRNSPRLEKLEADFCHLNGDGINSIATWCSKLMRLDTFKLLGCVEVDTIFENLKYLRICRIENGFNPLISLVTRSPVIQQIRIDECSNAESFPMDIIMQKPCMRKLIINDGRYDIYTSEDNRRIIRLGKFVGDS